MRDDFGIFIVSHARAEEVLDNTLKVLQRGRYTGQWWIVVDDEDPQLDLYKELWSKRLLIFSKKEMLDTIDCAITFMKIGRQFYLPVISAMTWRESWD